MASVSKQAGLLWALLALPGAVIWHLHKAAVAPSVRRFAYGAIGFHMVACLVWPLGIAPSFVHNQGVVAASLEQRSIVATMWYSLQEYVLTRPHLLLLWAASSVVAWRKRGLGRTLYLLFLLPSIFAWFAFGAYSLRLGLHVVFIMAFIVAMEWGTSALRPPPVPVMHYSVSWRKLTLYLVGMATAWGALLAWVATALHADLSDGARTTLIKQWGPDHIASLAPLLQPDVRIWIGTSYALGALHGRSTVFHAGNTERTDSADAFRNMLLQRRVQYVITSDVLSPPQLKDWVQHIHQSCQAAMREIAGPPNDKDFRLYTVDLDALHAAACIL